MHIRRVVSTHFKAARVAVAAKAIRLGAMVPCAGLGPTGGLNRTRSAPPAGDADSRLQRGSRVRRQGAARADVRRWAAGRSEAVRPEEAAG